MSPWCPLPSGQGTMPDGKVQQLFKMASHCLERGEDIFTTARKEQRPLALFRLATPSPISSPTLSTPPIPPASVTSSTMPSATPNSTLSSVPSSNRARASTLDSSTARVPFRGKSQLPGVPLSNSKTIHPNSTHQFTQSYSKERRGSGSTAASSSQNKVGNWMASKRSKLPGIPGLRRNGEESVDGSSQPQQHLGGYQRSQSAVPAPTAGEDRSKSTGAQTQGQHQ